MDLIAEQIDKYHRVAQGEKAEEVFPFEDSCLICKAIARESGFAECGECPLGDGNGFPPCVGVGSYVDPSYRGHITRKQARARRDYLVRRINESGAGIEIYFE